MSAEYKLLHCSGTFLELDVPVLLSSFQASSYSGSSVPRTWSPLIQPPPIGGWTRTLYLLLRSLTQSIPWVIWTASVTCLLRAVKRMEVNWMPNPPPPWVPLECCHSTDEASPLTGLQPSCRKRATCAFSSAQSSYGLSRLRTRSWSSSSSPPPNPQKSFKVLFTVFREFKDF